MIELSLNPVVKSTEILKLYQFSKLSIVKNTDERLTLSSVHYTAESLIYFGE